MRLLAVHHVENLDPEQSEMTNDETPKHEESPKSECQNLNALDSIL